MFASGAVDLGAPVMEFTALVVTSDTDSGDEYEPITITVPEYNQNNVAEANEFDSDIAFHTEESVTYQNVTVRVEQDPDQIYSY
jgi:hypothetical protein